MIDSIDEYIHDQSEELEILDPRTGEGLGIFVEVYGVESDEFISASTKYVAAINKHNKSTEDDLTACRRARFKYLARATKDWRGMPPIKGRDMMPFARDNAEFCYRKVQFIREQVSAFIDKTGDFTGAE